jgi:hypothetical protein
MALIVLSQAATAAGILEESFFGRKPRNADLKGGAAAPGTPER